ncbi:hypothetical protein ACHAXT_005746 [Thalassiosira profunda]
MWHRLASNGVQQMTLDWLEVCSSISGMEMDEARATCERGGRLLGQCTSLKRLRITGLGSGDGTSEEMYHCSSWSCGDSLKTGRSKSSIWMDMGGRHVVTAPPQKSLTNS